MSTRSLTRIHTGRVNLPDPKMQYIMNILSLNQRRDYWRITFTELIKMNNHLAPTKEMETNAISHLPLHGSYIFAGFSFIFIRALCFHFEQKMLQSHIARHGRPSLVEILNQPQ